MQEQDISVVKVGPSTDQSIDHHRSDRRAFLLAQITAYIQKSGDGQFAVLLGDALQELPEVKAYYEDLTKRYVARDSQILKDIRKGRYGHVSGSKILQMFCQINRHLPTL